MIGRPADEGTTARSRLDRAGAPPPGIYWSAPDNDGEKLKLKNSDGNNILSVEC